jgi:hypothetical protein
MISQNDAKDLIDLIVPLGEFSAVQMNPLLTFLNQFTNYTTVDPTANDDVTQNYIGMRSTWYNSVTGNIFICIDDTATTAVWLNITPSTNANSAFFVNITKANLIAAVNGGTVSVKTQYRITDSTQGIIRVYGVSTGAIDTLGFKEGSWDGITYVNGQIGLYNISTDVFTVNTGAPSLQAVYSTGNTVDGWDLTMITANSKVGITKGSVLAGSNSVVAFGESASSVSTVTRAVAIGKEAGMSTNGTDRISIGDKSGSFANGSNVNTLGLEAGKLSLASNINAFGYRAGYLSNVTTNHVNALGNSAASGNLASYVNALGRDAASNNAGGATYLNAIGDGAGSGNFGNYCNFIGADAGGGGNSGNQVIAIGRAAGYKNTGQFCTFIGRYAGTDAFFNTFNTLSGQFVISNSNMPSYADRTAAELAITVANGAVVGSTYLYYNQATFSIGAVRFL